MSQHLLNESQSSARPVKPLVRSVNVKLTLGKVSQTDLNLIIGMIKKSVDAFDDSVETRSGERFDCFLEITIR